MGQPSVNETVEPVRPLSGPGAGKGRAPGCRRHQFCKGNPGPPGLRKLAADTVFVPAGPLADLRWVLTHEKRSDVTPGQKAARRLLERNYRTFVTWYAELEAEERAACVEGTGAPGSHAEETIADAGAERVAALIEMKLAELERGEAG